MTTTPFRIDLMVSCTGMKRLINTEAIDQPQQNAYYDKNFEQLN